MSLDSLFDHFIRERIYVRSVTPATRLLVVHDERLLRLLLTFNAKRFRQASIHAIVVALLDTGCPIQELLPARTADFDFDQLLLTVTGKGRKERRVPFSAENPGVVLRERFGTRLGIANVIAFPTTRWTAPADGRHRSFTV
jgi:integrase